MALIDDVKSEMEDLENENFVLRDEIKALEDTYTETMKSKKEDIALLQKQVNEFQKAPPIVPDDEKEELEKKIEELNITIGVADKLNDEYIKLKSATENIFKKKRAKIIKPEGKPAWE